MALRARQVIGSFEKLAPDILQYGPLSHIASLLEQHFSGGGPRVAGYSHIKVTGVLDVVPTLGARGFSFAEGTLYLSEVKNSYLLRTVPPNTRPFLRGI